MNGRQKGSRAERDVAKMIEAWWCLVEGDARFVRTPLSGGWGGPELRAGFRASGDLMTTAKRFPFAVEVKRRESFSWRTLVDGRQSPVWAWWAQTVRAADEMGATPMLWVRRSNEPWLVLLPEDARPMRGRTAVAHDVAWSRGELRPVRAWLAERLLAADPASFLRR